MIYGHGVDRVGEVAEIAVLAELVAKAGSWISVINPETGELRERIDGTPMKFQGIAKFTEYLREDKRLATELESHIRGIDIEMPDAEPTDDQDGYGIEGEEGPVEAVA